MTSVVCNVFSKSAKQKRTRSPVLVSRGMRRTDLKPGKGRKISRKEVISKKTNKELTRNFTFSCVERNSFNVNGIRSILGDFYQVLEDIIKVAQIAQNVCAERTIALRNHKLFGRFR